MISGKAIFEAGFKFSVSETRKKFDSTASAYRGAIEGRLWSNQGVIGERAIEQYLTIYEK